MARRKSFPLIEDFGNIPEEALVPEDEQPYEIPDHWKWVRLGSVSHVVSGGTPSTKNPDNFGGGIPWITPADLGKFNEIFISEGRKSLSKQGLEGSSAVLLPAGAVCMSSRAPVGNVAIAANSLATNQGMKSFITPDFLDAKFLFYYLKASTALLESYSSGTTFLELSATRAKAIPIPLAPLGEQEQIVAKLEVRLAQIDHAIERTEAVLVDVDQQMVNLVRAAFTGHLTKAWREANIRSGSYVKRQNTDEFVNLSAEKCEARKKGFPLIEDFNRIPEDSQIPENEQPHDIPTDWKWVRLGSVCEVNPSKPDLKGLNEDRSTAFIPMAAVSDDSGTVMEVQERPLRKVSRGYTYFGSGDVLFAKITPCMENGKSAIVPNLSGGLGFGSTEFFVLRPIRNIIETELLHAFLRSPWFRAIAKGAMTGAVGQQRVPKAFLESYPYPLAPLSEQKEIVSVLGRHLESYQSAQSLLNESLKILRELRSSTVSASLAGRI